MLNSGPWEAVVPTALKNVRLLLIRSIQDTLYMVDPSKMNAK